MCDGGVTGTADAKQTDAKQTLRMHYYFIINFRVMQCYLSEAIRTLKSVLIRTLNYLYVLLTGYIKDCRASVCKIKTK